MEGSLTSEEVLAKVKEMQYAPIRIQELTEAKHIFSHIEWHMKGYAILVEEAGLSEEVEDDLVFVDAEDASARYAIPAAFAAYAKYMNIKLGNERFEE